MLGTVSLPPEVRDIRAAIAAVRGARNVVTRRRREEAQAAGKDERDRRRHRLKAERESEKFLAWKVRIQVREEDRAPMPRRVWRDLHHRVVDGYVGKIGRTDSRGWDGLYPIHFAFTPRGFATPSGRAWRRGEAMRAGLYVTRDKALEDGDQGWWANCADDRDELVAFLRILEEFERNDRSNANVYVSEIIALPAELMARQRRAAVKRICRFFDRRGLAYIVGMHLPDPGGDQRNFHCHIVYSLRPVERVGPYDWSFSLEKHSEISTPAGIAARRWAVVKAINETLAEVGIEKRYTHLRNADRGLGRPEAKIGQAQTWLNRRIAALERTESVLSRAAEMADRLVEALAGGAALAPLAGRVREALERTRDTLGSTGRAPKGRVMARLVEVKEHLEAVARADQLSSLSLRVDSASEKKGLLEGARDRIAAAASLPPALESLASDVQGRLLERRSGLPRDGAVLPELAVRVKSARRRQEERKKVAEQVAGIDRINQASAQFSGTSSGLKARVEIALAKAKARLSTVVDAGTERLAGLGAQAQARGKELVLRDRQNQLAFHTRSMSPAAARLAELRGRVVSRLHSNEKRILGAIGGPLEDARQTAASAPPNLASLQSRIEVSPACDPAQPVNESKSWATTRANEHPESRPAPAAREPRHAAPDPQREAAVRDYAEHIRTNKDIVLTQVGDREVVDAASLPQEWRLSAAAFDEEPEVLSAISEVAANKKDKEAAEAARARWTAAKRQAIIDWARGQIEPPVYPAKGRWHLRFEKIGDEDLRYYAQRWRDEPELQKDLAHLGVQWVLARPRKFDLAGVARNLPGTRLARAIEKYLAKKDAVTPEPIAEASAAANVKESAPAQEEPRTPDDAAAHGASNAVLQAFADKKKKSR